jgi:hypothetical protein
MAFINGGLLSAEIYIDLLNRSRNLDAFYALKDNEELIAKELGESVLWEELPRRRACRIRVTRPGEILKVETHSELISWLISQQLNFKKVFRSLVDDLPSEIWDREITEENSDVNDDTV